MKKICTMILAALCAVSMSAQMRIWYNGQKLSEINLSMIDSITFVKSGEPVNPDTGSVTPPQTDTITFDYDHWREQTKIRIYGIKDPVALPWAGITQSAMPDSYTTPDKEFRSDGVTPRWQLAFNLCDSSALPGTNMFGLWDSICQVMRIYVYVETLPSSGAQSCFYSITSSVPAFVDSDTKGWQPEGDIIKQINWNDATLGSKSPSTTYRQLLPVTGTLNGQINPGWICFELNFAAGIFDVPLDATITFALYGIQEIAFIGSADILGSMESYGGKLTIPNSKNNMAGAHISTLGGLISSVCSFVSTGVWEGNLGPGANPNAWWASGFGCLGAAVNAVGGWVTGNHNEVGKNDSTKCSLNVNFHIHDSAQFNGSMTSTMGTEMHSVKIKYASLFEQVLNHRKQVNSLRSGSQQTPDSITLGVWNLKRPPVVYVETTGKLGSYADPTKNLFLLSFLDPTSIEVMFNTNDNDFPYSEIDSVAVVAYDFVFINKKYKLDAKQYADFYGIRQDPIISDTSFYLYPSFWKKFAYTDCLLDGSAQYSIKYLPCDPQKPNDTTRMSSYLGVVMSDPENGAMDAYDMMVSPLIHLGCPDCHNTFDNLGVAVIIEVKLKNGEKYIFSDRFLPEIRTTKSLLELYLLYWDSINNVSDTITQDHYIVTYPLMKNYQNKIKNLLNAAMNSMVIE